MFKTFHQYLETQQGEFPLTPRSSCCLLALIAFPHFDNWNIAGLVVIAIATTGLIFGLGLIIGIIYLTSLHLKNIKGVMVNQLKNNLKKLEELAERPSSSLSQEMEICKEIAAKAQQPIEIVAKEITAINSFTFYLISSYQEVKNSIDLEDESLLSQQLLINLKAILEFLRGLEQITIPRLTLLYPDFSNNIEEIVININNCLEQDLEFKYPKFIFKILSPFNKSSRIILKCFKLIKINRKKAREVLRAIQDQKNNSNLIDYPWGVLSDKAFEEIINAFTTLSFQSLSLEQQDKILKGVEKDEAEYLEEIGLKPGSTLKKLNKIQEEWNQGLKNSSISTKEKIDLTEQYNVQKSSQQFSKTTFYLQLQEKLIELLVINQPTQEQQNEIEQLKQALDPILVKDIESDLDSYNYLRIQAHLFEQYLPELKEYQGFYVFFEDGEVKDYDLDEEELMERVLDNNLERKSAFIDYIY